MTKNCSAWWCLKRESRITSQTQNLREMTSVCTKQNIHVSFLISNKIMSSTDFLFIVWKGPSMQTCLCTILNWMTSSVARRCSDFSNLPHLLGTCSLQLYSWCHHREKVEICRRRKKQLSIKLHSTVLVARNGVNSSDTPALSKCKDFLIVSFINCVR